MLTEEQLRARIKELEGERDKLMMAANRELAGLTGRIEELKRLLADDASPRNEETE